MFADSPFLPTFPRTMFAQGSARPLVERVPEIAPPLHVPDRPIPRESPTRTPSPRQPVEPTPAPAVPEPDFDPAGR
jgi:hypothetical protein